LDGRKRFVGWVMMIVMQTRLAISKRKLEIYPRDARF
jgi:hypothetical protein